MDKWTDKEWLDVPFEAGEPVLITVQGFQARLGGKVLFHMKSIGNVYKVQLDDGGCVRIAGWRLTHVDAITRLGRVRT